MAGNRAGPGPADFFPMRERYFLEFIDRTGTDAQRFATFRLGRVWARLLNKGDLIYLANDRQIYGSARVLELKTGSLNALLLDHAKESHLELGCADPENAPKRRFESIQKLYGPHKAHIESLGTVILLRRTA